MVEYLRTPNFSASGFYNPAFFVPNKHGSRFEYGEHIGGSQHGWYFVSLLSTCKDQQLQL
jgi:hypothetical protein